MGEQKSRIERKEQSESLHVICAFFVSSLTYHSRQGISGKVSSWIFQLCTLLSLLPRSLANPNFLNLVVSTVEGKQNILELIENNRPSQHKVTALI